MRGLCVSVNTTTADVHVRVSTTGLVLELLVIGGQSFDENTKRTVVTPSTAVNQIWIGMISDRELEPSLFG